MRVNSADASTYGIVYLVLAENGFDRVDIDGRLRDQCLIVQAALVFAFEVDVRRFFVQPYAEPFEFMFDETLVAQRFEHIEHDEDQIASSSD